VSLRLIKGSKHSLTTFLAEGVPQLTTTSLRFFISIALKPPQLTPSKKRKRGRCSGLSRRPLSGNKMTISKDRVSPIKKVREVFIKLPAKAVRASMSQLTTTDGLAQAEDNRAGAGAHAHSHSQPQLRLSVKTHTQAQTKSQSHGTLQTDAQAQQRTSSSLAGDAQATTTTATTPIEEIYFDSPDSREALSDNPGDHPRHEAERKHCTAENWRAEIERRLVAGSQMVDHAYEERDVLRDRAYGHGDGLK
jgi:hypothetical protein